MVELKQLHDYCNQLLAADTFRDYCPNGLQVEGRPQIKKIVAGVTASQAFLQQAIAHGADAVLVHHGYFWKGENATITGAKKRRLQLLLQQDVSLLAYHLPLDAHAQFGNNVTLAQQLGFVEYGAASNLPGQGEAKGLLWQGELPQVQTAAQFTQHIQSRLRRSPLHLPSASQRPIKTLAWCTGAAQGYIEQAAQLGVDAYVSGEVSEQTFHLARELDIHYFAIGHHASESFGVQALAQHLAQQFALDWEFVDIANPV
jgi:dinuclear metal center YbgI/SA1388 family protein